MNKKIWIPIIVIALLIGFSFIYVNKDSVKQEQKNVVLGVILPVTGEAASYGESARNAVDIAVEKAKEKYKVEFSAINEDSQLKPATAASVFQKLAAVDKAKYAISFSSGETLAICPIAEKSKVILLSSGSSPEISKCGEYTFRNFPSDIYQGKVLADRAEEKGFNNVGLVYLNNDYGNGLKVEFIKNYQGIFTEYPQAGGLTDFRTQITKIKESKPSALIFIMQPAEAIPFLNQLAEFNFSLPIIASEALKSETVAEEVNKTILKDIRIAFVADYKGSEANEYKIVYKARFGKDPEAFSDYVYDNVLVLAQAIQECKVEDVECVKKHLQTINMRGATGEISFDQNGDVKNKPYSFYKIEDGKFVAE